MATSNVPDEFKQELIEKHWDINVDHEWWDCVYDTFKEDMKEKGIEVVRMYFSGFYSQGDGACFDGLVPVSQFSKFMEVHDLVSRFPAAKFFADNNDLRLDMYHAHHHYYHENTVDVSLMDISGNPYEDFSTRWEVYDTMQTLFHDEEQDLFEVECEEIVKGYMRELYSRLQKDYEYLTSEEVVWETIVANELHLEIA